MTPDEFINRAIDQGEQVGLDQLGGLERLVFLVSEVEVLCAMEGIDSFAEQRGADGLREASAAFRALGAGDLADALLECAQQPNAFSTPCFERANNLVNKHVGWDYEAIRRVVASRLGEL